MKVVCLDMDILAHACSETALSSMASGSDEMLLPGFIVTDRKNKELNDHTSKDLDHDVDDCSDDASDSPLGISENIASIASEDSDTNAKLSSRGNWTIEEDEKLRKAVAEFGGRNWKKIAEQIAERTDVQCLHRWQKVLRPGLIKGPWTPEVQASCF